jgi:hypothetical protein
LLEIFEPWRILHFSDGKVQDFFVFAKPKPTSRYTAISPQIIDNSAYLDFRCPVLRLNHDLMVLQRIEKLPDYLNDPADREFETRTGAAVNRSRFNRC